MTPAYARDENVGFSTFSFDFRRSPAVVAKGAVIVTQSTVTHVGRTSLAIEHRLQVDDREVARLTQRGVHLDKTARRPSAWPEAIVDRASQLAGRTIPSGS